MVPRDRRRAGRHGLRTLTLTRSGWQAFSATELLILVVAVLTLLVVIGMPLRRSARPARPTGRDCRACVVAALGAIAFVVVLARLTTAPGTTKHALDETMVAIRWGIFLALACSAALTAAGLRLIRAPQHAADAPDPSAPRRAARPPRAPARAPSRPRAPDRPRVPRRRAPAARPRARPGRARPSATRTDGSDPSATAPEPAA